MKRPCVYILASQKNGTLYIGVTSHLTQRINDYENGATPGFVTKHGVMRLVWFEEHDRIIDAIQREKSLKRYPRQWKINLIEEDNPHWQNLNPETGEPIPNPDVRVIK